MKFDPSFVFCKDVEKSSVKVPIGNRDCIVKSKEDPSNIEDHFITWKNITSEGLNLNYAQDFMPKDYANEIFERLEKEVVYLAGDLAKVKVFGKWHNIPRQHVAYGDEGVVYKFSSLSVPAKLWIGPLQEIRDYIKMVLGRDYNFVLVNRYRDGKDYMGEHKDDEKELDESGGIVSISLGAERDFLMRHGASRGKEKEHGRSRLSVRLEHGSCLLMEPPTNTFWYHSLPPRKTCLSTRINLTFRRVIMDREKKLML